MQIGHHFMCIEQTAMSEICALVQGQVTGWIVGKQVDNEQTLRVAAMRDLFEFGVSDQLVEYGINPVDLAAVQAIGHGQRQ